MARLSLYRPEKSNDYKFFDRNIKEMFQVGGTDLYVHKYIGANNVGTKDNTLPVYDKLDPSNIQDLLFLENRDRKYDKDIVCIRGHYSVQNLDFDLSQFGLFLNNDIIFITVHYNTMIELLGRKLIVGDVLELPHLTDYHPLNETIPVGLRRYYQITDGNFASEGFSNTWYSHLWRIKCEPLVDSQEFSNILSAPLNKDNFLGDWNTTSTYVPGYTVMYGDKLYTVKDGVDSIPANIPCTDTNYWTLSDPDNTQLDTLSDILGRYNKNIAINDATIAEAARLVPKTGYDRSQLYLVPTQGKEPAPPVSIATTSEAPVPTRGTVQLFYSAGYSTPTPVLNIGAQARKQLQSLSSDEIDALTAFMKVSLSTAELAPERLDTGAGQVNGTMVLALAPVSRPYGTADNTYSSADQFPPIYFQTSGIVRPGETSIPVVQAVPPEVPDTWYENPGLNVDVLVVSTDSTFTAFPLNTNVIGVDVDNNLLLLDKAAIALIPGESYVKVAGTFVGEPIIQNEMDYRADADPRFMFVRFATPLSFGYQDGYLIGDGTAPNGLPTGAGITFPSNPTVGTYFLRTDYLPNLLYRYDGSLWIRIGQNVRADPGSGSSETQLGSFINNNNVTTLTDGTTIPEQQSLTNALKLQID